MLSLPSSRPYRGPMPVPSLSRRLLVAAIAVALLSGCARTPPVSATDRGSVSALACERASQSEQARALRGARISRGGASEISKSAAVALLGYRFVGAAIREADTEGDLPGSVSYLAVWITNGSFFSEVSERWDGRLLDGHTLPVAAAHAARERALECLNIVTR